MVLNANRYIAVYYSGLGFQETLYLYSTYAHDVRDGGGHDGDGHANYGRPHDLLRVLLPHPLLEVHPGRLI